MSQVRSSDQPSRPANGAAPIRARGVGSASRAFIAVGLLLILLLALLRAADPLPVKALRAFYFDSLQRASPRLLADAPVRVVDIDEASLAALGQWPWPRDRLAELVLRLGEYGAAVVAFDVLFAEPDRLSPARLVEDPATALRIGDPAAIEAMSRMDNDVAFAEAMEALPVVLGIAATGAAARDVGYDKAGFVEIGSAPGAGLPFLDAPTTLVPVLEAAAAGIGSISIAPQGSTASVREVPLVWRTRDGYVPSLAVEALRLALGESTVLIRGASDIQGVVEAVRVGGFEIPSTSDGALPIRYRREDPGLYVSAARVLAGTDPELQSRLEGHIVLVGTSAAGLLDIRGTALGENVPGVSIHAQMLEQILAEDYLTRTDAVAGLELLVFAGLGTMLVLVMAFAGPAVSIAAGGLAGAMVLAGSWYAFRTHGILFDATFPLAGGVAACSLLAAWQFIETDREKRLIRRSFSHYVAPEVLRQIERSGHRVNLGGEIRTVTVMFCDIRDFTPLSESVGAADLVRLLNLLFTEVAEHVLVQSGTIDKFIGDALMAFWNAPLETPEHRLLAARAALGIRAGLTRFNTAHRTPAGAAPIHLAIGLASGEACVGNIGSRQRFNYSLIGDTVNTAARIESSCRHLGYDIVISEDTRAGLGGAACLPAGEVVLKGKSGRMPVHILVGGEDVGGSPAFQRLQAAHERLTVAMRAGSATIDSLLAECLPLAMSVEPGLATFYARIRERPDDFSPTAEFVLTPAL